MSLYRKYRPKDFPSLVGQDHIKITLLNAIKAGKIAHAYLFTGPRGTGKTTTARLLAKAINAEMTEDGRFDGSELAEEIDNGRLIDVIEIDAASNRGIDEIRDLREKINYSPTRAKNKVYIIDEVHMLTKEAFNALLKTLEEPPSFVFFILATTEIHKVPETIISRCQRFDFRRITENDLMARLKVVAEAEEVTAEEEGLKIIAKQARGGLRDALSLFEQLINNGKLETDRVKKVLGISNFGACAELFETLEKGNAGEAVDKLEEIFQGGVDLIQLNRDFLDFLRQKMLTAVKEGKSAARMLDLIANFQEAYEKQKFSYIPELPLEVAIVKSTLTIQRPPTNITNQVIAVKQNISSPIPTEQTAPLKTETVASHTPEEIIPKTNTQAPTASQEGNSITLETLLSRWARVADRIQNPVAKRCLMTGKPVEILAGKIVMAFSSNFNRDKLFANEMLAQTEDAIAAEFGLVMRLDSRIDPSAFAMRSLPVESAESPAYEEEKKDQMLESALNAFGGELVN
jgi:DNA polymerase-3 subunit gamma/tau